MKRYTYSWLLIVSLISMTACQEEKEEPIPVTPTLEITDSNIDVSYTQADIHLQVETKATIQEMVAEYSMDTAFASFEKANMSVTVDTKSGITRSNVTIRNLKEHTQYYLRCRALNKMGSIVSQPLHFSTKACQLAQIHTDSISNLTVSSVLLHATLVNWGSDTLPTVGFCYADHQNVTVEDNLILCLVPEKDTVSFSAPLEDLEDNKKYYFRAFAINCKGVAYGQTWTFTTTEIVLPSLSAFTISDITYTSAKAAAEVTADGGAPVLGRGICYSAQPNPTIESSCITCGEGVGAFSGNLTHLNDGKKYYVRAYAVNVKGVAYSQELSFTTNAYGLATVSTTNASNISYTSATVGGNVTADGGQTVTERGVCYSTSSIPTTSDSKTASGSGTGPFSCNLTGLSNGTTYYYRAYAINSKGTKYGERKSFTTNEYGLPVVSTNDVSGITAISAITGGKVTADGGDDVTDRGVCYGLTANPTISGTKVVNGYGLGSFTCNLMGLTEGTTYHVRAYATNSKGTSYGEDKTFTTTAYLMPTVTTASVTEVSYTTATAGGNVTADGGQTVTEKGVCFSTSSEPTIYNTKVAYTIGGIGAFTCALTALTPGTTYYVRAYAKNSKGTGYGNEVSFSTPDYGAPIVSTSSATNVSYTSATCGGNVTSDGAKTITERGICYSIIQNPTVDNSKVTSEGTMGAFSCDLTGLSDGTTYYFRAYAINAKGTSYGEERSFTTSGYKTPVVVTSVPNSITATTAICGGNVTSDGGMEITERGVCYSTWHELPNIDHPEDFKMTATPGTGVFTCELDGLISERNYYVRAYAINSKGITYGETKTFTTAALPKPSVGIYPSDYSYTTATFFGTSTSDSSYPVTERGFCYSSTQTTPDVNNATKVTCSLKPDYHLMDSNMFSSQVTDLTAGTMYYVRAFATNDVGTSYSELESFTTTAYQVPDVSTYSVSNITYTTATCGGNISSDKGQTVTARGVCYSTSSEPTIANNKVLSSTSYSSYSCEMTDLQPGTTYYVRAFATNSEGTGYGNEVSFTTVDYALPTVTTSDASYVSFEAAICGGNVTDDGASYVEDRGVCYATNPNPTMMDYTSSSGTGTGKFTCPLTDLSPNTTYYYRAFATNAKGTALGEVKSFTTVDYAAATIYYTANHKLAEKYGDPYYEEGYVSLDAFESALDVHTFENGEGMIRFTNKITKIGSYSFDNCKALITITLPYSVTTIEYNAFEGCSGLVSFEIPENVSSLSPGHVFNIFEECSSLTAIHVAENNQYFCDVDGVLFNKDKTILYQYPDAKPGDTYTIPNSVTELNDNAFKDCNQLTSVVFPNGLQKIEWGAFRNCKGITYVNIPDNVTYIGSYAFENCSNIHTLFLGSGLTGIDGLGFNNCSSLTSITSKAITPPSLYSNWGSPFQNVNKEIPVYVPGAFINAYKNASGWSSFTNIQAIP